MPNELLLNGRWELRDEILTCDLAEARRLSAQVDGWIETPVPGDIHQGLIEAGRIKEPLLGLNSFDCAWTEARSWWYRKAFDYDPDWQGADVVELELDGLDSNAEIFVNGAHVGSHRNSFRPFVADVQRWLQPGRNVLLVRLSAGVETVTEADFDGAGRRSHRGQRDRHPRRAWRAAPHAGAQAAVFVRLGLEPAPGHDGHRRRCAPARAAAPRASGTSACSPCATATTCMVTATVHCRAVALLPHAPGAGARGADRRAGAPRRRRARGAAALGAQPRRFHAAPARPAVVVAQRPGAAAPLPGGGGGGAWLASALPTRPSSTGCASSSWRRKASFAVVVNGKRVFCKGADWIPADAIYARTSDERYETLVREARDANFNMLRIWGGGWYERDAFYEPATATASWSGTTSCSPARRTRITWSAFRAEVEREADYQTKRLRQPRLHRAVVRQQREQLGLPRLVARADARRRLDSTTTSCPRSMRRNTPGIPYWNGSPYGGDEPNASEVGDRHHWGDCMMNPEMEKRITPEEYDKCTSLFVSEFGYIGRLRRGDGPRPTWTARRSTAQRQVWQHHTNTFEKNTVEAGIRKHYADPAGLADLRRVPALQRADARG